MFIVDPTAMAPFLVLLYDHFPADHVMRDRVRQLRRAGGATELTARIAGQVCRLADHRILVSVPVGAHRMGNPCYLLFESAVALAAPRVGRCLCGFCDLGPLPVAATADVPCRNRIISWRGRVVGLHSSLA
jgi:hypothetical protein